MLLLLGILYALSIWPIRLMQSFEIHLTQIDIVDFDEECIENLYAEVNEKPDGNNTISTSFDLTCRLEDTCEVSMMILLYSGGDYIETGISMNKPICEVFDDPLIVGPYVESLGMKKDECPPPEGEYRQEDYVPNMESMPVALPDDDYRMVITLISREKTILSLAVDFATES